MYSSGTSTGISQVPVCLVDVLFENVKIVKIKCNWGRRKEEFKEEEVLDGLLTDRHVIESCPWGLLSASTANVSVLSDHTDVQHGHSATRQQQNALFLARHTRDAFYSLTLYWSFTNVGYVGAPELPWVYETRRKKSHFIDAGRDRRSVCNTNIIT